MNFYHMILKAESLTQGADNNSLPLTFFMNCISDRIIMGYHLIG